ncbi:MAG: AIR synthase related protein, partial [Rhizobiaceae bacterium]|nr:AIR synthase related protein [Rhizobiaceae bacterium]
RFRVLHQGEEVANLPIKKLGDEAPEYDRPYLEPGKYSDLDAQDVEAPDDYNTALLTMLGSPNMASRRWVWEQYDSLIQANTLQIPGGDAGVVRICDEDGNDTGKALAFSSDVNPRYCEADAYEGGKQAVAECYRNLSATGATPLAATDNLNFGNPEKPEIMGQFVAAIKGIGEACSALDMPIVSGNVSLYNETKGKAILPTPTIGGVGLLSDHSKHCTVGGARENDVIFLIGETGSHLGQSTYMRECLGLEDGPPPPVDLSTERKHGEFVRAAIQSGYATACHDISDGGLAIALAEMCLASGLGAIVSFETEYSHGELFGEDQARYLFSTDQKWADMFAANAEGAAIAFTRLGTVGADSLKIGEKIAISIDELRKTHEAWFPQYMGQTLAAQ